MWKNPVLANQLREYALLQGSRCVSCQFRNAAVQVRPFYLRQYASKASPSTNAPADQKTVQFSQNPKPAPPPPSSESKQDEENPAPRPLDRPLGTAIPPREGQNTGIDPRNLRQRRDDFVDYDRHIARRKEL